MCLTAQEKIRNRMNLKNKTAGHAGMACFSFALKGNRAGSPHVIHDYLLFLCGVLDNKMCSA